MKKFFFVTLVSFSLAYASLDSIKAFEGDFKQIVIDDKDTTLEYKGKLKAKAPQFAVWDYDTPVKKTIYIDSQYVTIVEPELEQVIIKGIDHGFDFFSIIKNAVQINKNTYRGRFRDTQFVIKIDDKTIKSIAYNDEFDNYVKITFTKRIVNPQIDTKVFKAVYPTDFDVITE